MIVIVVESKLDAHSGEIEFKSHFARRSDNDNRCTGNDRDNDSSANILRNNELNLILIRIPLACGLCLLDFF